MHTVFRGSLLLFTLVACSVANCEQEIRYTDQSENDGVRNEPEMTLEEDPFQIPAGALDVNGDVFDVSRVEHTEVLRVTNGGRWGSWGPDSFCPPDSFAAGYDMKIEPKQNSGDDTSLNGIKIICKNRKNHEVREASSTIGPWGSWVGSTYCNQTKKSTDYLTAFSLQVEPYQGIAKDDTAANYVKFMCRGLNDNNSDAYERVTSPGHGFWGIWGRWSNSCPQNNAICGIATKVEKKQTLLRDDTALNSVLFYCCK